jgi:hypothetical protein
MQTVNLIGICQTPIDLASLLLFPTEVNHFCNTLRGGKQAEKDETEAIKITPPSQ